jgi:hypothetical protein
MGSFFIVFLLPRASGHIFGAPAISLHRKRNARRGMRQG